MKNLFIFLLVIFVYNDYSLAMEKKPYHHLPNGAFRNPEGSPERNMSFNWSYKIFNKEKKKLNMEIPDDHVVNKNVVLKIIIFCVFSYNFRLVKIQSTSVGFNFWIFHYLFDFDFLNIKQMQELHTIYDSYDR